MSRNPQPQPQRVWPFPPRDPAERERIARQHREQQRKAIANEKEALL